MATISENLQIIKNSTDTIKQAIIDKGGTINGDITTWADAITGISGGGSTEQEYIFTGTKSSNMTELTLTGRLNKIPDSGDGFMGIIRLLILCWGTAGLYYASSTISSTDSIYALTIDFKEPITDDITPAICILNVNIINHTIIPVKFQEEISTNPA